MINVALAGNANCGKTTLFNALTGANQFVGNWPGVTVEKKSGRLKKHKDVVIQDLPGIYSLSPYSPEEVVSRRYLIDGRPDVIVNVIDGTNLERNLYLIAIDGNRTSDNLCSQHDGLAQKARQAHQLEENGVSVGRSGNRNQCFEED